MQRSFQWIFLLPVLAVSTGCLATHPNTTAGGLLGGTTGGVIGAAVGTPSGNSESGALIGALAGGLTGAAIGNQTDEAIRREQQHSAQQAIIAQNSAVTLEQVIQMTGSGLSDELITNQIRANGVARRVNTNDIIELKRQGVSEAVILQLQTTSAPAVAVRPYQVPAPIVEVTPYCPPPVFRPPGFRRPRVLVPVPIHRHRRGYYR